MSAYEEYTALVGTDSRMVAVVTRPARGGSTPAATGLILLGAGLIHHVGPNRLTVRLARRFAEFGYASVRFDHCGIGDSAPRADGRPFSVVSRDEAIEVMDWFSREEGVRSFVLLGICSGAETAMGAALVDPRVRGCVMINGGGLGVDVQWDSVEYVRSETRHYLTRLFSLDSWVRSLTGRIQYRRLFDILSDQVRNRLFPPKEVAGAASALARDLESLVERQVQLLWVQSERDISRGYFDTMFGKNAARFLDSDHVQLEVMPFVDHVFNQRDGQVRFLDLIERWLVGHFGEQSPTTVEVHSHRMASS